MKKIISIVISIVMVLSLFSSVAVFANSDVKSVVKHVSADQIKLVKDGGEKDIMKVGGLNAAYSDLGNIYAVAKDYAGKAIKFWGWIGTTSAIKQFGYSINGAEVVWNDNFAVETGSDVVNAAQGAGATHASRFSVEVPLTDGVVNVKVYVKTAATIEVIWKASYVNAETRTIYFVNGMNVRTIWGGERLGTMYAGRSAEILRTIPKADTDGTYDYFEIVFENHKQEKQVAYIADVPANYTTSPVVGELPEGAYNLWVTSQMNIRSTDGKFSLVGAAPVGTKITVLRIIPKAEADGNYDYYEIVWPSAEGGVAWSAKIDANYSTIPASYPVVTPYYVINEMGIRTSPSTADDSNKLAGVYLAGEIIDVVEVIDKATTGDTYDFLKVYTNDMTNEGYVYVAIVEGKITNVDPRGADPIISVPADPETGDFGLIALAFVAISSVVVKKRKEN